MATAEQLKLLAKAHYEGDKNRFDTVLIQIAASEANKGHSNLARDLKKLIDKNNFQNKKVKFIDPDLENLIVERETSHRLSDLVVGEDVLNSINNVIKEYRNRQKLLQYGLQNRKKLLLAGPPGTGKTLTASVLTHELGLPLFIIQTDRLVTKYLGETSQKLSKVFEYMENFDGVYLFDEFDSIASERNFENDVGEIRRVINSFLQQIEANENCFIIGATNNPQLLDKAIFRRFDDVIVYDLPDFYQIKKIIENTLATFIIEKIDYDLIAKKARGLSHAEVVSACKDSIKESILNDLNMNTNLLKVNIEKRIKKYSWEK